MKTYFKNIYYTTISLLIGLKITLLHFIQARHSRKPVGVMQPTYFDQKEGIVTLQYPDEKLPVPDNGRYKLHNEIDDCIVCDKCAKICPVNCIDIEPIRAVEEFGKTSDGTPKRLYAAKFDIDMSKCCFCGLCTVVCPTECLTMTKEYDFSTFDVQEHNFEFGDMSSELISEKQAEFDVFAAAKQKEKDEKEALKAKGGSAAAKPKAGGFKPRVKPLAKADSDTNPVSSTEDTTDKPVVKPKFRPKVKASTDEVSSKEGADGMDIPKTKPIFRPKIKPKTSNIQEEDKEATKPKAAKPVFRPKIKKKPTDNSTADTSAAPEENLEKPKPVKPVFRPKIKVKKEIEVKVDEINKPIKQPKAEKYKPDRPVFKPKVKGGGKAKPVITPIMKNKSADDTNEPEETN